MACSKSLSAGGGGTMPSCSIAEAPAAKANNSQEANHVNPR